MIGLMNFHSMIIDKSNEKYGEEAYMARKPARIMKTDIKENE